MQIQIPAQAVATDALVELGTCPRHGRPGVRSRKTTYYTKPPLWTLLLVVLSLLLGLIVILLLRKQVSGKVLECDQCIAAQKRFRITSIAGWVVAVGLLFVSFGTDSGALVLLAFLALFAALIYSFTGATYRVRGYLTKDRFWVELKNIDPGFGEAVRARMAAASPAP